MGQLPILCVCPSLCSMTMGAAVGLIVRYNRKFTHLGSLRVRSSS